MRTHTYAYTFTSHNEQIALSRPSKAVKASKDLKGLTSFVPDYTGWCTLTINPQGTSTCYILITFGGTTVAKITSSGGSSETIWLYVYGGYTYTVSQSASSTVASIYLYYWVP